VKSMQLIDGVKMYCYSFSLLKQHSKSYILIHHSDMNSNFAPESECVFFLMSLFSMTNAITEHVG
jgi:hypothetical protein